MHLFFDNLVQALCRLYERGFILKVPSGNHVCVKGALVTMSLDAPARALLLEMMLYSGAYGCSWCENPGYSESNGLTKKDGLPQFTFMTQLLVVFEHGKKC
eukprot:Lithocolla_globosa_v1_NODE_2540_length_1960_cov_4.935958.p2 type:complete len:101 gc:universal NODE_2540_length_1960_cov_4.935958:586-888(+)